MKPKITPPSEFMISIKEYERLLRYEKVYRRLRQYFNPYAEMPSVRYRAKEVLDEMTKILKQSTSPKIRREKE